MQIAYASKVTMFVLDFPAVYTKCENVHCATGAYPTDIRTAGDIVPWLQHHLAHALTIVTLC